MTEITNRKSLAGVPHTVVDGRAMSTSVCYFKSSDSWRVFWPYPAKHQGKKTFSSETKAMEFAASVAEGSVLAMARVESSNVEAVGHDGSDLHVRFKGGKTYVYADVPAALHAEMMQAESVGRFLNQRIKGKYQFRVSE